ncbi:pyridoxamine 5'-phosphate oxidase family protein [Faecalibacter rhinopitheci]|uniref:Pyridoxamine 5'-phosphate oxidase family protein n=1 Tax=Faecalibacter rhinopitheci TaxID=2779678 RepID=A0A8J7FQK9_9FLAO|nr:pyridoxamine 5'-phosphate oxidase family protein [Faecalibacter rhinopitheci]MBF0596022.1 pyridoxamine 5'-phosphate oxidase family protein [Faecalibacter rhinopitheci]
MGKSISPTENLAGNTAIEKIKTIAENAGTCFFSTNLKTNTNSRPMALQEVDDNGNLWFLSDVTSEKNKDILQDPDVELYFMNNSKYEYVFIKGKASVSQDKVLIDKYWSNFANAWFDGKDDPNVSVIKVTPNDGYYYETKENKLVAMSKMLFAAATGSKIEDGGVEGSLEL